MTQRLMRRAVVRAVFALALSMGAAAGCTHYHRPWNAPGVVDVKTPPRTTERDHAEWPGDPGERYVSLTYGAFSGIGAVIDGGADLLGAVGVEVSLHRGTSEYSHNEDDFYIFPLRKWEGLNLGWTVVNYDGDDNVELGPIYLEAQRAEKGGGIAVGLAFDPNDRAVGPQVTVFFASLYLRADYLYGVGPSATAGWIVKLPVSWVWSQ